MSTPVSRPIRVAVAGIGFIGPIHIESLRRIPGIEMAAICHSNEQSAKEKAGALQTSDRFGGTKKVAKSRAFVFCTAQTCKKSTIPLWASESTNNFCSRSMKE